jgi:hypothetical protein
VAVNCRFDPVEMLGLVGVTAIDTSVAEVTARVVVPETIPDIAVIVVDPAATALAKPLEPAALLMVPIAVFDEAQVTAVVRF